MINIQYILLFIAGLEAINYSLAWLLAGGYAFSVSVFRTKCTFIPKSVALCFLALFGCIFTITLSITKGSAMSNILHYLVLPLVAYLGGWNVVRNSEPEKREKEVIIAVFAIVAACLVHALFNLVTNMDNRSRIIIDAFSGSGLPATNAGYVNTLVYSVLICAFIAKSKIAKTGIVCACLGAFMYNMILANRTQLIIFITVFAIMYIMLLKEDDKSDLIIKFGILALLGLLIVFVVYRSNAFNIRTVLENSNLFVRMTQSNVASSDNLRLARFFEGVQSLINYPFGNTEAEFFHNMWLDAGRRGGLLSFVLLAAFSCATFFNVIKIYTNKKINKLLRFLLLAIYIGTNMNFFVEPILDGYVNFFLVSCSIYGMTEGLRHT